MNGISLIMRGLRLLREEGVPASTVAISRYLAHRYVSPYIKGYIEQRLLNRADIKQICENEETLFAAYNKPDRFLFSLPITPVQTPAEELQQLRKRFDSEIEFEPPFLASLSNVTLLPPEAIPVRNGSFVPICMSSRQVTTGYLSALFQGTYRLNQSNNDISKIDTAICLTGPLVRNYYHWFNNYLTRLRGYEWYRNHTETNPSVLIPANPTKWMQDSLRAVGVSENNWIEWSRSSAQINQYIFSDPGLTVVGDTTEQARLTSPSTYRWLSSRITQNIIKSDNSDRNLRIFISRENASTRDILNENEIMDVLGEWGFKKYQLERLSFKQQVSLFAEADAVAGAHGAGLMNILFSQNPYVIEFLGPKTSYDNPGVFYTIAQSLGHEYGCLEATVENRNLYVNPDSCYSLLKQLNI